MFLDVSEFIQRGIRRLYLALKTKAPRPPPRDHRGALKRPPVGSQEGLPFYGRGTPVVKHANQVLRFLSFTSYRGRTNKAHKRQSRPDSCRGVRFQVKDNTPFQVVPSWPKGSGRQTRPPRQGVKITRISKQPRLLLQVLDTLKVGLFSTAGSEDTVAADLFKIFAIGLAFKVMTPPPPPPRRAHLSQSGFVPGLF